MKKISLITSVALIASLGLVGCGGGGSVDSSAQGNISIAGTAIDPELQHATVCLDLNQDMSCSQDEPTATTDGNGAFSLSVSQAQVDGNYPLIVINGIDRESGEAFKGKLMADVSTNIQNITPLTTLAYAHKQKDMGKMEKILGLTHDEIHENMIKAAEERGDITPLKIALTLEKSAEALAPKDPFQFYKNCSEAIEHAKNTSSLKDIILSITPITMRSKMDSFLKEVLNTSISDAYALSEFTRDEALKWSIDHESMMEEITNP